MKNLIYADHAATTPLLPEALEAMLPWLKEGFGNPSSLHSYGREARKAVEEARVTIAECINAKPEEIFFTSGGTEANNWVIKGTSGGLLVSAYEHHSVFNAAKSNEGRKVKFVSPTPFGLVTSDKLRAVWPRKVAWPDGVSLVSVMAVNNEIGTINPIDELAEAAHRRGALFHTDAVQAVGKMLVDVRRWNIDFMSASAHKFGGPKGVGFLYAKDGKAPVRLFDGGTQEREARAGTENVAGIVGMATALRSACEWLEDDEAEEQLDYLTEDLCDGIRYIFPEAVFHGKDACHQLSGFVSVAIPGHSAEGMLHIFDMKGIAISAGAACNSKKTEVSHVLKAIGLPSELAVSTLRISLSAENSGKDVNRILDVFRVIKKARTV